MKERVSAQRLRSPLRRWQAVSTQNFERIFRLKKDKPLAFGHEKIPDRLACIPATK